MSSGAAQTWFNAGAITLMLAAGGHAVVAVMDAVRPTFLTPIKDSTMLAMKDSGMKFRALFPGDAATPSIWRLWLGFNVSHGLGGFAFGLICLLIGTHDFDLVGQIGGLRALTIAIPAAYLAISLVFWFYAINLLVAAATACFIVSALAA
ncbi:MAG TPA: hypothetical protein VF176_02605 [Solirubrobacterales bacterium]